MNKKNEIPDGQLGKESCNIKLEKIIERNGTEMKLTESRKELIADEKLIEEINNHKISSKFNVNQ